MSSDADSTELVRDMGEFRLIDILRLTLPTPVRRGSDVVLGIGDDAAVLRLPENQSLVVTSDAMVDKVHFRLDWTDWRSLGHKLLAVNLSDLAAMGASPLGVVLTLGLTGEERVSDLVELYAGLGDLALRYGVVVCGGDVVRSRNALFLDLTAFGSVVPGQEIRRSGAHEGDLIAVSGMLGASAAGLALLESGDSTASTAGMLIASHLRPEPRLDFGKMLWKHGVSAAMDLSDGLFGDLPKLLYQSGVCARIEQDLVPIPAAVRALFPDHWFELGTAGGEDYELLLTFPPALRSGLTNAAAVVGSTITVIGEVVAGSPGGIVLIDTTGQESDVDTGAFDHFRA
ncbi:MAG: thiamine-phosphate kinase [Thermomicrobiales bacterium]